MTTMTLRGWTQRVKALLKSPGTLGVFAALYTVLLVTLYIFVSTREATVFQVAVTFICLFVIPVEFFVLQAAIVDHTRDSNFLWSRIAADAVKFAVATIPIIVLGYVLYYLFAKLQLRFPAPKPAFAFSSTPTPVPPIHRPTLILASLRGLVFGVVLPLMAIHLWIEVAGRGLRSHFNGSGLKRLGQACARAFSPESVLVYATGLVLFVVIPYAVLYIPYSPKGNKTEFVFFVARLLLAFAFSLIGWVVTISTLSTSSIEAAPAENSEMTAAEAPA